MEIVVPPGESSDPKFPAQRGRDPLERVGAQLDELARTVGKLGQQVARLEERVGSTHELRADLDAEREVRETRLRQLENEWVERLLRQEREHAAALRAVEKDAEKARSSQSTDLEVLKTKVSIAAAGVAVVVSAVVSVVVRLIVH